MVSELEDRSSLGLVASRHTGSFFCFCVGLCPSDGVGGGGGEDGQTGKYHSMGHD